MSCFIRSIGMGEPAAMPVLRTRTREGEARPPELARRRSVNRRGAGGHTGGSAYRRPGPRRAAAGPRRGPPGSAWARRAAPCTVPRRRRRRSRAGRISRTGRRCTRRASTPRDYLARDVIAAREVRRSAGTRTLRVYSSKQWKSGGTLPVLFASPRQRRDVASGGITYRVRPRA